MRESWTRSVTTLFIYKIAYLNEPAGTTLDQARMRLGS
jgi:hypothetical protein